MSRTEEAIAADPTPETQSLMDAARLIDQAMTDANAVRNGLLSPDRLAASHIMSQTKANLSKMLIEPSDTEPWRGPYKSAVQRLRVAQDIYQQSQAYKARLDARLAK